MSAGLRIGLTGKAGAGKGVVADYLVEHHGFTKVSFAGPLKKMLRTLDPVLSTRVGFASENRYSGDSVRLSDLFAIGMTELQIKASKYGPEYRRLLQVLGTDCIRALDETFWVRAAMQQITAKGNYVFDDVRFPNEALAVQAQGTLWCIMRDEHDGGAGNHSSEQWAGQMNENYHLPNDGTIAELCAQVDSIMSTRKEEASA